MNRTHSSFAAAVKPSATNPADCRHGTAVLYVQSDAGPGLLWVAFPSGKNVREANH